MPFHGINTGSIPVGGTTFQKKTIYNIYIIYYNTNGIYIYRHTKGGINVYLLFFFFPSISGVVSNNLADLISTGTVIFLIGILGIFLNKKNIIIMLMSIEIILLAVNLNLVVFSIYLDDLIGQLFTLLILTVAASESAIGLAILVAYYRIKGSIAVQIISLLKN